MTHTTTNLRQLFALEEKPADGPAPAWQDKLRERLDQEVTTIKWTAAMPDLVGKIGELLDLEIPGLLMLGWKKADEIAKALAESVETPDESIFLGLAEHEITSEHKPYIEIRLLKYVPLRKRIEFTVTLAAKLAGIELEIKNGAISRITAGSCEGSGTLALEELQLAEKKFGTIRLDGLSFYEHVLAAPEG